MRQKLTVWNYLHPFQDLTIGDILVDCHRPGRSLCLDVTIAVCPYTWVCKKPVRNSLISATENMIALSVVKTSVGALAPSKSSSIPSRSID
jgi:hypothetical protein